MNPIQYIRSRIQVESGPVAPDGDGGREEGHDRAAPLLGMMARPIRGFFEELIRVGFVSTDGGRLMFELTEAPFSATFVLSLAHDREKPSGRSQFCIVDVDVRERLPYFYCFDSTAEEKRFQEAEEMLRTFARDFVQEVRPRATDADNRQSMQAETFPPSLPDDLEGLLKAR